MHHLLTVAAGIEGRGMFSFGLIRVGFALCFALLVGSVSAVAAPMGEADARHFLERTGFGAPPPLVAQFARLSREQAVDRLLVRDSAGFHAAPPSLDYQRPSAGRDLDESARKAFAMQQREQGMALRQWWLEEMLHASTPTRALRERMTLFWHNHFVSSQQKVKSVKLMLDQNLLLRRHALGNFSVLLHSVSKDPAMLIYLDGANSRKASPNENFAREVMELFTLGEGNYSEQDVKEAARAFTGWSFERETGTYLWRPGMHDGGEKSILGRTGSFDGDQVLDILLAQPKTAEFIVGKLWREFISPTADATEVRRIGAAFRSAAYEVTGALRPLLLSKAFWAPENRGALVKSPVDLLVGTLRTLETSPANTLPVVAGLRQLGQDLFAPPNVKGWPGGSAWINTHSLLARKQFLERLLRAEEMAPMSEDRRPDRGGRLEVHFDSLNWLNHFAQDPLRVSKALLALAPVEAPPTGLMGLGLIRTLLLDPVYQLK